MQPDDERVPFAFEEAKKAGMAFEFGEANLKEAHPNSVVLKMVGESGKKLEVIAASLDYPGARPKEGKKLMDERYGQYMKRREELLAELDG